MLLLVDTCMSLIRDKIISMNISKDEVSLIENILVSRCVPFAQVDPLLQSYPGLMPLRMVSLVILANTLLEMDLNFVINNFFGGNKQIVNMLIDRNCC